MIVDYNTGASYDMPKIPIEFFEMVHNISKFLLLDDRHDIGRFSYRNRTDYYWKGTYSPDHISPLHHWYLGWIGMIVAQIGAITMKGLEVAQTYDKVNRGNMSDVDSDVLAMFKDDDDSIALDDYKEELYNLPFSETALPEPVQPDVYQASRSSLKVPKIKLLL